MQPLASADVTVASPWLVTFHLTRLGFEAQNAAAFRFLRLQRDELAPLHSIKDCLLAIVERSSWMLPRARAAKQPSRPKWTRRS
jgi:hypothetical protein